MRKLTIAIAFTTIVAACTLDFGQYRDPAANAGGNTTTNGGNGGNTMTTGGNGGTTMSTGGSGGTTMSTGGSGGSGGGNPMDCPATQPVDQDDCSTVNLQCVYGDQHCECWQDEWDCDTCPTAQPTDDADCSGMNRSRCFYGGVQCYCLNNQDQWNCEPCPADPVDNTGCGGLTGLHCSGSDGECSCFSGDWNCN